MAVIPCQTQSATAGNYTLGTFKLSLRQTSGYQHTSGSGNPLTLANLVTPTVEPTGETGYWIPNVTTGAGWPEWWVGNIQVGSFSYVPTILEHRRGVDNSLDGVFTMGKDYTVTFTADELTGFNLAMVLSENTVLVGDGQGSNIYIPLRGAKTFNEYGVKLIHVFPDNETKLIVEFWRAAIMQEFTLDFSRDSFAAFQGTIRALYCDAPMGGGHSGTYGNYGRITLTRVTSGTANKGEGDEGWFDLGKS